jgi:hypothetical protein
MSKKKQDQAPLISEWPHKIETAVINHVPKQVSFSASEQERKDLARRLQVNAVESAEAQMTLQRDRGSYYIHVTGSVKALIRQSCVVTLELLRNEISDEFEAWYTDQPDVVSLTKARREKEGKMDAEVPIMDEHEDPEKVVDGHIDLGELAAQYLSLAINPYPHADGAEHEQAVDSIMESSAAPRKNPFAALKDWKFKGDDKK